MNHRHVTRRLLLMGAGASLTVLACGDDEGGDGDGGDGGAGAASGTGADGTGATGTGATGTGATGGASTGGGNVGGAAGSCGAALLVMGSNYDVDPHDVSIPVADLMAGVTKTYTSTGGSHTHDITLTGEDFIALQNGETVTKYVCLTDPAFIDHEFAISCADPNIMPILQGEIGTENDCPA